MANLPPIQFKRSNIVAKKPVDSDLVVGELAINMADGLIYSRDSENIIRVAGAVPDSEGNPIKVIRRYNEINEKVHTCQHILYRLNTTVDAKKDWYEDKDAVYSNFGATAEVITYIDGERKVFDSTTRIWLDGSTTTNQSPTPGGMTVMPVRGLTALNTNNWPSDMFMEVYGHDEIAGYTPKSFFVDDAKNLGLYGFQDGNDYLIRFWAAQRNTGYTNNYSRYFGFTNTPITTTGTTAGDTRNSSVGFFFCNAASATRVFLVRNSVADTFDMPGNLVCTDGIQYTWSCKNTGTNLWDVRVYFNGLFQGRHIMDIRGADTHFRFGTGSTQDDRDSNINVSHVQVDEYVAGDLESQYSTDADYVETNNIYKLSPTEAYAANYFYQDWKKYKKISDTGANTLDDWLLV